MRFSINEFQKWLLLFMSLMWEEIPATGPDSWVWFPLGMRPHISLLKFSVLSPAYSFIVIILMTSSPPADQQSISKSEKLSVNNTSLQPCWWLCEVLWARWQCLNANVQQVWCLACSPSYISPSACTHLQIRTERKSAAEADEWLKRQEALQMLHWAGNNVCAKLKAMSSKRSFCQTNCPKPQKFILQWYETEKSRETFYILEAGTRQYMQIFQ